MANLKASRGYYPVVALADTSTFPTTLSSPTSQFPKGPGKGKSKGKGKGKPKGKLGSAWQTKGGTIQARAQATKCLKCGQPGHWAAQCPQGRPPSSKGASAKDGGSSSPKRSRTDGAAMMVRDLTQEGLCGLPHLSDEGWYGIQDGGASSVVCGHDTLMQIVDYLRPRGVHPDRFQFLRTNKLFGFGGDAARTAEWSVRLPCYIGGYSGYMECFIVDGFLVGRPILKALKVCMDYESGTMSVNDGEWHPVPTGVRGEFLLRLDDGLETDPGGTEVKFDYVTDESYAITANAPKPSAYVGIHEYLACTGRQPLSRPCSWKTQALRMWIHLKGRGHRR